MSITEAVRVRPLRSSDASACDAIVAGLPYHFGDAEGRRQCVAAVREQEGLVAEQQGNVLGFLTFTRELPTATEITWLAVRADRRRSGVGSQLIEELVAQLEEDGCPLLVVSTLADIPEEEVADGYAATRLFYSRRGFLPAWMPKNYWSEAQPALLMVRLLAAAPRGDR